MPKAKHVTCTKREQKKNWFLETSRNNRHDAKTKLALDKSKKSKRVTFKAFAKREAGSQAELSSTETKSRTGPFSPGVSAECGVCSVLRTHIYYLKKIKKKKKSKKSFKKHQRNLQKNPRLPLWRLLNFFFFFFYK